MELNCESKIIQAIYEASQSLCFYFTINIQGFTNILNTGKKMKQNATTIPYRVWIQTDNNNGRHQQRDGHAVVTTNVPPNRIFPLYILRKH